MTRADLKQLIRSWCDDLRGTYFTDDQLNLYLNMAQREVQKQLLQAGENYYMKPVETLTVMGQSDYVLPVDFFYEHRIEIVLSGTGPTENKQSLVVITTNQQDLFSVVLGTPGSYYIKKDRITLLPTPQQQWVMRLYYSPVVVDMTDDTDTPDVPLQFQEYVAVIAAFDCFVKDDRVPNNIQMKKDAYEKLLKQAAEDRTQDMSRQVVQISDYDWNSAWF